MYKNNDPILSVELYAISDTQTSLNGEHSHSYHELYFMLEGNSRHFINNKIMDISAGQAAFVWQGYVHKVLYNADQSSRRLLVNFNSAFIGEEYWPLLRELRHRKHLTFTPEVSDTIKHMLLSLHAEKQENGKHSLLQCQNILRQIIILLSRQPVLDPPQSISQNETIIQQAAQYISSHYPEPLTLQSLSQEFFMSESHFSRTFKKYTGMGVAEYIKYTRLRAAEKLLMQKASTVTEIAFACGFNNSNYFICEFKKHHGVTPLKYAATTDKKQKKATQ